MFRIESWSSTFELQNVDLPKDGSQLWSLNSFLELRARCPRWSRLSCTPLLHWRWVINLSAVSIWISIRYLSFYKAFHIHHHKRGSTYSLCPGVCGECPFVSQILCFKHSNLNLWPLKSFLRSQCGTSEVFNLSVEFQLPNGSLESDCSHNGSRV